MLIGMLLATKLSFNKNICSLKTMKEIERIYISNKLPSKPSKYLKKKQINNILIYRRCDPKILQKLYV